MTLKKSGEVNIEDLYTGMSELDLVCKVVKKYELREFTHNGREGKVANVLVGDETGVIRLVLWHKHTNNFDRMEEGTVLKVKNCYVRENNDRAELHTRNESKVILNPEGEEVEVKPRQPREAEKKKIENLTGDEQRVELLTTVVQVFDPSFFDSCPECRKRVRDGKCPEHGEIEEPEHNYVLNLHLDDGTGVVRTTFWKDQAKNLLGLSDDEFLSFKKDPSKFEHYKTDLLGVILKVVGSPKYNEQFDRLELTAREIEKEPSPEEEIKKLDEVEDSDEQSEGAEKASEEKSKEKEEDEKGETSEKKKKSKKTEKDKKSKKKKQKKSKDKESKKSKKSKTKEKDKEEKSGKPQGSEEKPKDEGKENGFEEEVIEIDDLDELDDEM